MIWTHDGAIKATPSEKTGANERCSNRADAGHGNFVVVTESTCKDWVNDKASDALGLWGALGNGTDTHAPLEDEHHANNPCPEGYRIPTTVELQRLAASVLGVKVAVSGTTSVTGACKAFGDHPVHLTFPGERVWNTGNVGSIGSRGVYWTNVPAALTNGVPNNATRFLSRIRASCRVRPNGRWDTVSAVSKIEQTQFLLAAAYMGRRGFPEGNSAFAYRNN